MNKFETPLLTRSYHIPLEMFDDAFRNFQKKYVLLQNIAVTAVLLAIAGVYVHAALKDNTQTLAYLLIVACIAIILVRWYRMFKLRRAVHDALKEIESDTYEVKIYSDGMTIRTEEATQTAEESAPETEQETQNPEEQPADADGFRPIFPEEPAAKEQIPATEIYFGKGVNIHEFPEYFMVYLVKQNFYVIPKKDFSEDEITELKKIFHLQ